MTLPKPLKLRSVEARQLDALIKRREQLVKQRAMEKQHLEAAHDPESIRSIEKFIRAFDKEIDRIEDKIRGLIAKDSALQKLLGAIDPS